MAQVGNSDGVIIACKMKMTDIEIFDHLPSGRRFQCPSLDELVDYSREEVYELVQVVDEDEDDDG